MKEHRKVFIQWVDSRATLDRVWVDMDMHDPSSLTDIMCSTCGWLIDETENLYCLALSINASQYGGCFEIPKVAVLRVQDLEVRNG